MKFVLKRYYILDMKNYLCCKYSMNKYTIIHHEDCCIFSKSISILAAMTG